MKKLIGLLFIAAVFFSCGPSKTVQQSRKAIKGSWVLNDISYNQIGDFNVELFNQASSDCFVGSEWQFVPNNNRGNYELSGNGCPGGPMYFIFVIQEVDPATGLYDFMLKPTNDKYKSETNAAFRLRLANLSSDIMRWEQTVDLDGSPFVISMNFSKTGD